VADWFEKNKPQKSDDWFAQNAADTTADGTPRGAMTPEQMFGPRAMTNRWLRVLPFLTGAGGAILPPPFGGIAGATGGGMLGSAMERGLAGQSLNLADPNVRMDIERAGINQGLLQAPASAIGKVGGGLMGLRDWSRNRAVGQAIKEINEPMVAGRAAKRAALAKEVPAASAARQQAAAATKAEIASSPATFGDNEVADRIIAEREARFGVTASPKVRQQIRLDVARRHASVLPRHTGRLIGRGKAGQYDAPTAQIAKQAFDDLVRAAHTGVEGGIRPKPGIDMDIANAWRSLIEERIPNVGELNQATRGAIKAEQSVKKLQKGMPTEEAARVRMQERDAATRAKVLANRSANPITLMRGLVRPGQMVTPGFGYRPGTATEFGGKVGEMLASAPAEGTAFALPRGLALYLEMLRQQQQNEPPVYGAPQ